MEDIDKKAAFHQLRLSPVGHQVDREILPAYLICWLQDEVVTCVGNNHPDRHLVPMMMFDSFQIFTIPRLHFSICLLRMCSSSRSVFRLFHVFCYSLFSMFHARSVVRGCNNFKCQHVIYIRTSWSQGLRVTRVLRDLGAHPWVDQYVHKKNLISVYMISICINSEGS